MHGVLIEYFNLKLAFLPTNMTNSYVPEVPAGLLDKILARIQKEKRFSAIRQTIIFTCTLMASLLACFPAFKLLYAEANQSGFLNFLSLIFSDFSLIMPYWQNFGLALLESLPSISLAAFLFIFIMVLQSIKLLLKNIKFLRPARAD